MFTTLPIAFGQMPGGAFVGAAFFLLLVVSALASAISLLELVVAWATERFGVSRSTAAYTSAFICWIAQRVASVMSSCILPPHSRLPACTNAWPWLPEPR